MKNIEITLAIVTKNRPKKLARVLASLSFQTFKRFKVILIDNDVNKSSEDIYNYFHNILNIKYYNVTEPGVPTVRNKALSVVKSNYLAFIDDDCVVKYDWVENAISFIEKHNNKYSYFVGNSFLLNTKSRVAYAQHTLQRYWFMNKLNNNCETSPFNVDTKNIIFNVFKLKENNIFFDKEISIGWFDSADVDVGFNMKSKGMKGIFVKNLIVWHEEKTSIYGFLKKGYYRGKLAFMVANKWKIKDEFVYLPFRNIFTYIKSVKGWWREYRMYLSIVKNTNFFSFLLIKLYEWVFLFAYIKQAEKMGVKL